MKKLTLNEFIEEMKEQPDCNEYISQKGNKCYRTTGFYNWYLLKCSQLGIKPEWIKDGLSATAYGNRFALDYTEHDIILCIYNDNVKNKKYNSLEEFIIENSEEYKWIKENLTEIGEDSLYDIAYELKPDFAENNSLMEKIYFKNQLEEDFDNTYDSYVEDYILPTLKNMLKDIYSEDK